MTTTKKLQTTHSTKMQPKTIVKKAKQTMKKAGRKGGAAMMGTAAGVVVGAAVGGLAGAAMSDKKTRQKLSDFAKTAADAADRLSDKAVDITAKAKESADELALDTKILQSKTRKVN